MALRGWTSLNRHGRRDLTLVEVKNVSMLTEENWSQRARKEYSSHGVLLCLERQPTCNKGPQVIHLRTVDVGTFFAFNDPMILYTREMLRYFYSSF